MDPLVPSVADSDDNEEDWEEIETTQAQPKMLEITLNPQPKVKEMKRFDLFLPPLFPSLYDLCLFVFI